MSAERLIDSAPTLPRCPGCAQPMRLIRRTQRFGGLPDPRTPGCRACNVLLVEECGALRGITVQTEIAHGTSMSLATQRVNLKTN
jgi:hypothetical protein